MLTSRNIEIHASAGIAWMLVGCKCDQEEQRVVAKERGAEVFLWLARFHHANKKSRDKMIEKLELYIFIKGGRRESVCVCACKCG